jgi:hypothetical protein
MADFGAESSALEKLRTVETYGRFQNEEGTIKSPKALIG